MSTTIPNRLRRFERLLEIGKKLNETIELTKTSGKYTNFNDLLSKEIQNYINKSNENEKKENIESINSVSQ